MKTKKFPKSIKKITMRDVVVQVLQWEDPGAVNRNIISGRPDQPVFVTFANRTARAKCLSALWRDVELKNIHREHQDALSLVMDHRDALKLRQKGLRFRIRRFTSRTR